MLACFPYLAQIIISISVCVACNNLWLWPIFSRSYGLDLENRVRSVASTVLDGFFPYLVQMITSMRRCVECDDLWPWPISSKSFDLDIENRVRSVTFSVLDQKRVGRVLNRHQTTLGVYVNRFGKTSVVWRYTLQSIGPSGVALNY